MELQEAIKEQIKDKRVLDIIDNCVDIIKSLGYKVYNNLDFVWDNKRHSFGTCYVPTSEDGNFTIALNKYLVDESDENIENVVCHELTHYIVDNENILSGRLYFKNGKWYFNKRDYDKTFDSSHGKNWQEIANNISSKIKTTIHPTDNYDFHKEVGTKMKETSKYIVRCKNCGWEDGYVRRTSFVSNPNAKSKHGDWYLYQCPKCKAKGEFETITNECLDEDLFEGSVEDKVISTLRTLGYGIKYMREGWYDEDDTPIDDWEDERDEPEDDWWYVETPYYRCANNGSQVEFAWRIDEYDKTFTIIGVYANYKGSIQGFASRTINDILEILPKDYTIEISNNINKSYWNHMKNKYSQYDWIDIEESLNLNEEHLKDNVSSAFDVECIQDDEEFMSLDKSYKQEYYKLIKEWNNLNAEYKEIIDKLNKLDYSLNDYNNPNSELDDDTKALWKESREINKEALDIWYKIEGAIERAKEKFNNDGESNVQITITSQNLDHYINKYFLPMSDDGIIKACSLITYDDIQKDAPIYLLPNGEMIGEGETHSSFLEIILDNVFTYLFGDRFIKDYDMYDCENYVYAVTKKKNWARLNCGQTPYEDRFYCVLLEEMSSYQWYSLEKFLVLGETLKIKNNEVLVYVGRDSHIYSYDEYAYEDILKRIKRYYSSGRFFENLNEHNNYKIEILSDNDFFSKLKNTNIENNRFDLGQFEKLKGNNDGFYCLVDNNNLLASACVVKNRLALNDLYINELQTFKKGMGKILLQKLFKDYKNVWLMAEPNNKSLVDYYSQFGLSQFTLPKDKSIYNVDTYYFTNIKDISQFQQRIEQQYSNEEFKESLSKNNNTFNMFTNNKSINNTINDLKESKYKPTKTLSVDNDLDGLYNILRLFK